MKRTNVAFWLPICIASVCLLVILILFTPLVRFVAEKFATDWYDGDADILVILGGGMLVDGKGPQTTLGYDSYLRTVYAGWYLRQHRVRFIVTSGANGFAESSAKLLIAYGVPASSVLLESRSHSTYENALYTKTLLLTKALLTSATKIAILTSDYHTWRAKHVFNRCGIPVRVIPVPDVIKRSGDITYRPSGALILLQELSKDVVYAAHGRL